MTYPSTMPIRQIVQDIREEPVRRQATVPSKFLVGLLQGRRTD